MEYSTIYIRAFERHELDLLHKLSVTTFIESYGAYNTLGNMQQYCENDLTLRILTAEHKDINNSFFGVQLGEEFVGYIKLRIQNKLSEIVNAKSIEIQRIYLLKEFQRRGIGRKMMEFCITYAAKNSFERVWLGVWEFNHIAIKFYQTFGFKKFGTIIFPFGDEDQVDYLMSLDLI